MPKQPPKEPEPELLDLLQDLIPHPTIFPDENPVIYENLRDALLGELAPGKPYELVLADNLVTLEWEAIRYRRMRDSLIKAQARDYAVRKISDRLPGAPAIPTEQDWERSAALVDAGSEDRADAVADLEACGIGEEELFARAYREIADEVERLDRRLAEIEVRRRRLREDYESSKAAQALLVEDAEVTE